MNNIKQVGIIFAVIFLFIGGSVWYALNRVSDSYDDGFKAGVASIKPVSTKIDTVRDTVWVKPKSKPKPLPIPPKDTAALYAYIDSITTDNETLKSTLVRLLEPKRFIVSDNLAQAIIDYDPKIDEYSGFLTHATINTETNSVKEPLPPIIINDPWYEDGAMYVAGGVTGVVVIASGGTVLLGCGVSLGVGVIISIF